MIKKLNVLQDISSIILQSILYYTFFIGLSCLSYGGNNINFISPLIIFLFITISYCARKFSKNILMLILVYILMFASCTLIPMALTDKIILSLIVIAMTFLSTQYWAKKTTKPLIATPHIAFETIFIIILLISDSSFELFINIICLLGTIYLIVSLLAIYIRNLKSYIKYNNHIEDLPISKVVNVTNLSLSYLFLGSLIFILLIKLLNIDKLFYSLFVPIINIIKYILLGILTFFLSFSGNRKGGTDSSKYKFDPVKMAEDTSVEPNSLINILFHVLQVAIVIGLILWVAYLIFKFFKTNFNRSEPTTDQVESIYTTDKINKISSFFKKGKSYENSNNSKIRKAYFKKVSKYKFKIPSINNLLTHIEISKEVNKNSDTNITELTNLYEKARYSDMSCSKEDLHKAKNL